MALAKRSQEADQSSLPIRLTNHFRDRGLRLLKNGTEVGHFVKRSKSDTAENSAPIFYLDRLRGFHSAHTYVFARLRWDKEEHDTALQILIGYYWFPTDREDIPTFMGFRFERGTGPDDDGNVDQHSYFHAQPCRNFSTKDTPEPKALKVPNAYPTIGVNASDYDQLFLQSILSISGTVLFDKFERLAQKETRKVATTYYAALSRVRESILS